MRSKSGNFFKKRGVSPLIATVLLISFAVALGSVVLNWGRNLDISKSGDVCSGIKIELRNINELEACYTVSRDDAYINFIIDNEGNVRVDGLGILITGEKGTELLDFNNFGIGVGNILQIKDASVKYSVKTYGAIKSIQFFPKKQSVDSIEICPRSSVKAELIGAC